MLLAKLLSAAYNNNKAKQSQAAIYRIRKKINVMWTKYKDKS